MDRSANPGGSCPFWAIPAMVWNAVDAGYFDVPKRTSMDRMSAKEGTAESTIQKHLSKAESKVLRALAPYLHLYESSV